ncbi:MAG: hypothetical protein ACC656_14605, partial [Candidatus Heimdallarchaeota archaeon]
LDFGYQPTYFGRQLLDLLNQQKQHPQHPDLNYRNNLKITKNNLSKQIKIESITLFYTFIVEL